MRKAVYPGSFDPITNGHLDIIERASRLFDEIVIAVLVNPDKTPIFSIDERMEQIQIATKHLNNVTVMSFYGLLVEFAKKVDAKVVVRGLRAVTDFENEFKMALINKTLGPEIETIFIPTSTKYLYLSSSAVREVARFGGNIDEMVHPTIKKILMEKRKKELEE